MSVATQWAAAFFAAIGSTKPDLPGRTAGPWRLAPASLAGHCKKNIGTTLPRNPCPKGKSCRPI